MSLWTQEPVVKPAVSSSLRLALATCGLILVTCGLSSAIAVNPAPGASPSMPSSNDWWCTGGKPEGADRSVPIGGWTAIPPHGG